MKTLSLRQSALLWSVFLLLCPLLLTTSYAAPTITAAPTTTAAPAPIHRVYCILPLSRSFSGIPIIQVRLNGRQTAACAIDTGTNVSIITDVLAAKMGLKPIPYLQDGKRIQIDGQPGEYVSVELLEMGTFKLYNSAFFIMKSQRLAARAGEPIDAMIGTLVMSYFATQISFVHRQVALIYPGGFTDDDIRAGHYTPDEAVALTPVDGGTFTVPVVLSNRANQTTVNLALDTGSPLTTISWAQAQQLHLAPQGRQSSISALSNDLTAPLTRMAFGSFVLLNRQIDYPDSSQPTEYTVLGRDILSGYRMLFDPARNKVYLAPETATPTVTVSPAKPIIKP